MMKNIQKRGKKFQVKFKPPGQPRVTGTFETEKEAEGWILLAKANVARGEPLPPFAKAADEATASGLRAPVDDDHLFRTIATSTTELWTGAVSPAG